MKTKMRANALKTWFVVLATATVCCTGSALAQDLLATSPGAVDFDAALRGLRFDPAKIDANLASGSEGDGMLDADQMALAGAVLARGGLDLSENGGVAHAVVAEAYETALAVATSDLASLNKAYPTGPQVVVGYALLGQAGLESMGAMTKTFGAPLKGDYTKAVELGRFFSAEGDADGDGFSNLEEYRATMAGGRAAFLAAALDPQVRPSTTSETAANAAPVAQGRKIVGVILYEGFEVLDVFGPVEMWSYVPDLQVITIAEKAGVVKSAQQGISANADYSFETAPPLDIVMVPGGAGTYAQLENEAFLNFLRTVDSSSQLTTSVCTGSALLAKAGLLSGRKATSNKAFFSLAVSQDPTVQWQGRARWVEDGKYITSSGVSAGTDMALGLIARLHGKEQAAMLARSLEYEWNDDPTNDPFAIAQPTN